MPEYTPERYAELAAFCRSQAESALTPGAKQALLKWAETYDRRGKLGVWADKTK
jgi:hypothetical protein